MNYKELSEKIDLSPLGLEPADNAVRYYCTPVDADIFARAGVDGIHYVTIPGYGEMVFCVDPSGCHMPEVFPIAEDFDDLWVLLLSCGDMTILMDADSVGETEFASRVEEVLGEKSVESTLKQLAQLTEKKALPLENAYRCLNLLKKGIDCSGIRYSEEYWEIHSEVNTFLDPDCWEVYYHGTFWGHDGAEQPCEELPFHAEFDWAGKHWLIPAAYICKEGLVLDLCMAVEREEMQAFIDKWNDICAENDLWEQYEQEMQSENPMQMEFIPVPTVNGMRCEGYGSCGIPWTPSLSEEEREDSPEGDHVAEHYGLDPEKCWMIHRFTFRWGEEGCPGEIESLSVEMTAGRTAFSAGQFECHEPGEVFEIPNPFTDAVHLLTVTDCHAETVNVSEMYDRSFPNQLYVLTCTMEPKPEVGEWFLRSVTESDEPRFLYQPESSNGFSYAIIGGADGPTAIVLADSAQAEEARVYASSVHFELPDEMRWELVWQYTAAESKIVPMMK